jgi:hypothetical protein
MMILFFVSKFGIFKSKTNFFFYRVFPYLWKPSLYTRHVKNVLTVQARYLFLRLVARHAHRALELIGRVFTIKLNKIKYTYLKWYDNLKKIYFTIQVFLGDLQGLKMRHEIASGFLHLQLLAFVQVRMDCEHLRHDFLFKLNWKRNKEWI